MGGPTMEEDKEKDSDNRSGGDVKGFRKPPADARANPELVSGPDDSYHRMLLDFFSKEQFVGELRTLNAKLSELQQWHSEWEQKRKALDDEREKYRVLEEAISEVILLLDASLRVLYCTSSMESLTGYGRDEVVSLRLEKLVTPSSLKVFMEKLAEELVANTPQTKSSPPRTVDLELYSKKGGFVTGSARIGIRRGTDHEPAEIMVIMQNVHEKRILEKALWEAKEQYRILFREMKEPAYFITAEGVFLDVNPAWLEWLSYGREEIIGVDIREIFSFPAKHPLYHHRAEGKETRELRARLREKSGAEQECVIIATAWRGRNGELLGYLGVVRGSDEDTLNPKPEGAKEDFRDMLLGAVAHEIKKPISVVVQGLEEVSKSVRDPLDRKIIEKISQAATRAGQVMNSILDLYRGSPPINGQTDVAAVNNQILSSYEDEIRARNISVITDFEPDLPPVRADAVRLGQVITNILTNSVAAMPRSGVITIRATKRTGEDGRNQVSLIYADTGSGMSENELRRVFDPFFTTKGHSGGIGLGLTLSKEIIERCGGSIKIESRTGEGTTVSLFLPCS